jgi:hypothetical protein
LLGTSLLALALLVMPTSANSAEGWVPSESTLTLALGTLPRIELVAHPWSSSSVYFSGTPGAHSLAFSRYDPIWSTELYEFGTSLFTGVPLLTNLSVSYFALSTAGFYDNFVPPYTSTPYPDIGPTFGGLAALNGKLILRAMGAAPAEVHLYGGSTTLSGHEIRVDPLHPFVTEPVEITGFTSNLITIPARGNVQGVAFTLNPTSAETIRTLSTNGGFVSVSGGLPFVQHTVTLSGTNNLISANQGGIVTMVSPARVHTGAIAGAIPGQVVIHAHFVPEPGVTVLLLAGVAGLVVLARRRRGGTE